MQQNEYSFPQDQLQGITVHLLVEILAMQKLFMEEVLYEMNKTDEEIDAIFKNVSDGMPEAKEGIIENLFVQFGRTPKI